MVLPAVVALLLLALTVLLVVLALGESRRRSTGRHDVVGASRGDRPGLATEQIFFQQRVVES